MRMEASLLAFVSLYVALRGFFSHFLSVDFLFLPALTGAVIQSFVLGWPLPLSCEDLGERFLRFSVSGFVSKTCAFWYVFIKYIFNFIEKNK